MEQAGSFRVTQLLAQMTPARDGKPCAALLAQAALHSSAKETAAHRQRRSLTEELARVELLRLSGRPEERPRDEPLGAE